MGSPSLRIAPIVSPGGMRDVRDIMDSSPASVRLDAPVEEIVALLRQHGLRACPSWLTRRCVGIVTEADLVLPDDEGDLHLPTTCNLFGGTVFHVEPLGRYQQRLRKAFASTAEDMMTRDDTVGPDTSAKEAALLIHEAGPGRLPVVEDGRLVGVVTRLDALGALAK